MHRLLVIGATALAALAFGGTAAAWSWPADGQVLRPYVLGGDAYAAGQHRGIDVAGPDGSPVRAPASGTVTFAGSLPTHGRGVTIATADGYAVTLVHLGAIGVAKGDSVVEGAPIGSMGSSGEPEHPCRASTSGCVSRRSPKATSTRSGCSRRAPPFRSKAQRRRQGRPLSPWRRRPRRRRSRRRRRPRRPPRLRRRQGSRLSPRPLVAAAAAPGGRDAVAGRGA